MMPPALLVMVCVLMALDVMATPLDAINRFGLSVRGLILPLLSSVALLPCRVSAVPPMLWMTPRLPVASTVIVTLLTLVL